MLSSSFKPRTPLSLFLLYFLTSLPPSQGSHPPIASSFFITACHVVAAHPRIALTAQEKKKLLTWSQLKASTALQLPIDTNSPCHQAVKKLWGKGYKVRIYLQKENAHKVALYIEVYAKRALLSTLHWEGISRHTMKALEKHLTLPIGAPCNGSTWTRLHKATLAFFHTQGYFDAKIKLIPHKLAPHQWQLTIKVSKGKRYSLGRLRFKGLTRQERMDCMHHMGRFLPEKKLKNNLLQILYLLQKKGILLGLHAIKVRLWRPYFQKEKLTKSLKKLHHALHEKGYLTHQITIKKRLRRGRKRVDIDFIITKGKRYRLQEIKWIGNHSYTSHSLHQKLGLQIGATYNKVKIEQAIYGEAKKNTLAHLYGENKKVMLAQKHYHIESIKGRNITIVIHLKEVPRPRIGTIHITTEGIPKDWASAQLEGYQIKEGLPFFRKNLQAAKGALMQTSFIQAKKLSLQPLKVESGLIDLLCHVPKGERALILGGHIAPQEGVSLSLALAHINLLSLLKLPKAQGVQSLKGEVYYAWGKADQAPFEGAIGTLKAPFGGKVSLIYPFLKIGKAFYHFTGQVHYMHGAQNYQGGELLLDLKRKGYREKKRWEKGCAFKYTDKAFGGGTSNHLQRLQGHISLEKSDTHGGFYPKKGTTLGLYGDLLLPLSSFVPCLKSRGRYQNYRKVGPFIWMQKTDLGACFSQAPHYGRFLLGGKEGKIARYLLVQDSHRVPFRGYRNAHYFTHDYGGDLFTTYTTELRYAFSNKGYLFLFLDIGLLATFRLAHLWGASIGIGITHWVPILGVISFYISLNLQGKFDIDFSVEKVTSL